MNIYLESLARAVNALSKLPGVGGKTALRLAYHVIDMPGEQVRELAQALLDVKEKVKYCACCGNSAKASCARSAPTPSAMKARSAW